MTTEQLICVFVFIVWKVQPTLLCHVTYEWYKCSEDKKTDSHGLVLIKCLLNESKQI